MKNIDLDALMHGVKKVRASMHVMETGIEGLYADDFGYFEADAMLTMLDISFKNNIESLDQIIADMREAGAEDYDLKDPDEKQSIQENHA